MSAASCSLFLRLATSTARVRAFLLPKTPLYLR